MTRLHLVPNTGSQLISEPARPSANARRRSGEAPEQRSAPRLHLVPNTGSLYRPAPVRQAAPLSSRWLSLFVAGAAMAASALVATRGFEQTTFPLGGGSAVEAGVNLSEQLKPFGSATTGWHDF